MLGTLLGYRVAPGRVLFLTQAVRLLIATLVGQLLLLGVAVAGSHAAAVSLPRVPTGAGIAVLGALLGISALLGAPGIHRAWPQ